MGYRRAGRAVCVVWPGDVRRQSLGEAPRLKLRGFGGDSYTVSWVAGVRQHPCIAIKFAIASSGLPRAAVVQGAPIPFAWSASRR